MLAIGEPIGCAPRRRVRNVVMGEDALLQPREPRRLASKSFLAFYRPPFVAFRLGLGAKPGCCRQTEASAGSNKSQYVVGSP
jgi:hypothetical protein